MYHTFRSGKIEASDGASQSGNEALVTKIDLKKAFRHLVLRMPGLIAMPNFTYLIKSGHCLVPSNKSA